jgi:hypothetical protein
MDDLKYKMKKANEMASKEYNQDDEEVEMHDVADLIVENKLLIDKVDAMLGKPLTSSPT